MKSHKILTIVGARPQFIKAAALSEAFQNDTRISETLVHTGQHFDANMSDIFFSELGIPEPKYHLGCKGGGSNGHMVGEMISAIDGVLREELPDAVMVYGDTNTTLAGAIAATKCASIPVIHIEAGLRSGNRQMAEETNRILVDHVSRLLFCPTPNSVKNLNDEGIVDGVIHSGDVMFDLARKVRSIIYSRRDLPIIQKLGFEAEAYGIATLHRAETTDNAKSLMKAMNFIEARAREHPIIMPLHPRTRQALDALGLQPKWTRIVDPLGYTDFAELVIGSSEILTDSGGLQKEAFFHRIPCITLRTESEWPETIEAGWNRLWTTESYRDRNDDTAAFGNGQAAAKITECIATLLS